MIFKGLTILLLAFALLSMTSRYFRPRVPPKPRGPVIENARKCPDCGAYMVGPAACDTPACPSRDRA